jgi:hypothetical protein
VSSPIRQAEGLRNYCNGFLVLIVFFRLLPEKIQKNTSQSCSQFLMLNCNFIAMFSSFFYCNSQFPLMTQMLLLFNILCHKTLKSYKFHSIYPWFPSPSALLSRPAAFLPFSLPLQSLPPLPFGAKAIFQKRCRIATCVLVFAVLAVLSISLLAVLSF